MKRVTILLLALALTVCSSVSGTLAYLQVTASATEIQTTDNVKFRNILQKWDNDTLVPQSDDASGTIGDTVTLYPSVPQDSYEMVDGYGYRYRRFTVKNAVDKYLAVKNTGTKSAYVRTFIAMEAGDHSAGEFEKILLYSTNVGVWKWQTLGIQQINGNNYYVVCAVYNSALEPGDTTAPSLLQLYLSPEAGNETITRLDGNRDGCFEIKIFSQATESDLNRTAAAVLNEKFPTIHPWTDVIASPTE